MIPRLFLNKNLNKTISQKLSRRSFKAQRNAKIYGCAYKQDLLWSHTLILIPNANKKQIICSLLLLLWSFTCHLFVDWYSFFISTFVKIQKSFSRINHCTRKDTMSMKTQRNENFENKPPKTPQKRNYFNTLR